MGRLVRDDRKAILTQITTRCNQGMQNTVTSGAGPRAVGTERGRWSNW